jgi:hypothetical protein
MSQIRSSSLRLADQFDHRPPAGDSCLFDDNLVEGLRQVPAADLGRHAAADLVLLEQLSVIGGPVLAALIGMDQQLFSLDLALAQGSLSPSRLFYGFR